jgi:hypothetical protein
MTSLVMFPTRCGKLPRSDFGRDREELCHSCPTSPSFLSNWLPFGLDVGWSNFSLGRRGDTVGVGGAFAG